MKCGKCGLDLKGENTYCPNCGTKLRNKDEQFGANDTYIMKNVIAIK